MEPAELVWTYIEFVRRDAEAGLDETVRALVQTGISQRDAEALVAFVPMAFGYVLLFSKGVTLSDSFETIDPNKGERKRGALGEQPIFQAAVELADRMFSNPDKAPLAHGLAQRSAEFGAASRLRPDGKNLESIVLTPAVLTRLPSDYL